MRHSGPTSTRVNKYEEELGTYAVRGRLKEPEQIVAQNPQAIEQSDRAEQEMHPLLLAIFVAEGETVPCDKTRNPHEDEVYEVGVGERIRHRQMIAIAANDRVAL